MNAPLRTEKCRDRVAADTNCFDCFERNHTCFADFDLSDAEIASRAAEAADQATNGDQEAAIKSRCLFAELRRRKALRW